MCMSLLLMYNLCVTLNFSTEKKIEGSGLLKFVECDVAMEPTY